jgi:glycine/D-amino acid oxidase-like deaminating enzyme
VTVEAHPAVSPANPVFWADGRPRPPRDEPPPERCDVLVVGAGYTGLWAALELLDRQPGLRVVVLDAARVGDGASGRNGGWLEPSLTHGLEQGVRRYGAEASELERIARVEAEGFVRLLATERIECDYESVGTLECAVTDHELGALDELAQLYACHGWPVERLDAVAARSYLRSSRPVGAVRAPTRGGLLNPFALIQGLAGLAERRGAGIHEGRRVARLRRVSGGVEAHLADGRRMRADGAVVAVDGGIRALRRRARLQLVPLEDYVMVSEPLGAERRESLGWERREGVVTLSGEFTSMRLTADDRIYWGGSEAVYRYGSRRDPGRAGSRWDRLAAEAAAWFPQLGTLRWTHRWTGTIPVTATAVPAFGAMLGGRAHYAFGYTGLGVLASRVGGRLLAARVLGVESPLDGLAWASRRPLPFPPEPARWALIELARRDVARADRNGRRSLYLRTLDRMGVGLTS